MFLQILGYLMHIMNDPIRNKHCSHFHIEVVETQRLKLTKYSYFQFQFLKN